MDRPLRVAIFGESFLPYRSGVTVSTDALASGLAKAGHRVLLVVPRPARGEEGAIQPGGPDEIEVAWLPSYQGPPPVPPHYRMPLPGPSRSLRAARDWQPDIIHAQSPFVSGLMARRVARATGAPLVFTHHTRFADYRHYLGPLAGPGARLTEAYLRSFWAGCAAIVAPSTDLAREIAARIGPRSQPIVRAIPTGLDVAALEALPAVDPRIDAGWGPDSMVVVSVGRLAREKSVDLLVEAFAVAALDDARLRLLLIGGGPLAEQLAARAVRPDLAGRVRLAGSLPRDDALALARGADLFAFASRTETQGLVLAEALAVGLPVVALAGPGVSDTVRDGVDGVVVPRPVDLDLHAATNQLAEAIAALAADAPRRSRLASAAREGAARFALADRIAEVVALYREVVAHR